MLKASFRIKTHRFFGGLIHLPAFNSQKNDFETNYMVIVFLLISGGNYVPAMRKRRIFDAESKLSHRTCIAYHAGKQLLFCYMFQYQVSSCSSSALVTSPVGWPDAFFMVIS